MVHPFHPEGTWVTDVGLKLRTQNGTIRTIEIGAKPQSLLQVCVCVPTRKGSKSDLSLLLYMILQGKFFIEYIHANTIQAMKVNTTKTAPHGNILIDNVKIGRVGTYSLDEESTLIVKKSRSYTRVTIFSRMHAFNASIDVVSPPASWTEVRWSVSRLIQGTHSLSIGKNMHSLLTCANVIIAFKRTRI